MLEMLLLMSTYRITVIAVTCGHCLKAKTHTIEVYRIFMVRCVGIVLIRCQLLTSGILAPPPFARKRM